MPTLTVEYNARCNLDLDSRNKTGNHEADLRITTTEGTDIFLDEATVQEFKARVRGPLIRPGDAGYDDARKIFNGMIDRHPALIVRCCAVSLT